MEPDFNLVLFGSMAIIIFALLIYIVYRFREEKVTLTGINADDLMNRFKEAEGLLQMMKTQSCWNCGSKDKDIIGSLYENDEVTIICQNCGTKTVWQRGKSWKVATGTKTFSQILEDKLKSESRR